MGPWGDIKIFGRNLFDFLDYLTCNVLMPLSALFVIAITVWFFFDKTSYEINATRKRSSAFMKFFRFMLAFVAPVFIVVVALSNFF